MQSRYPRETMNMKLSGPVWGKQPNVLNFMSPLACVFFCVQAALRKMGKTRRHLKVRLQALSLSRLRALGRRGGHRRARVPV